MGQISSKNKNYSREVRRDIQKGGGPNLFKKGGYYDIQFDFQRDAWSKLLKRIRKWEQLKAKDFDGWWPLSNADVTSWVSSLTELPLTSDGESTRNALLFML